MSTYPPAMIDFFKSYEIISIEGTQSSEPTVIDSWYINTQKYGTFKIFIGFIDDDVFKTMVKLLNQTRDKNTTRERINMIRNYVDQFYFEIHSSQFMINLMFATPCFFEYVVNYNTETVSFTHLQELLEYGGITNAKKKLQRNIYNMVKYRPKIAIESPDDIRDIWSEIQNLIYRSRFEIAVIRIPKNVVPSFNVYSMSQDSLIRILFHFAATFYSLYLCGINLNNASLIDSASMYKVYPNRRPKLIIYLINGKPYFVDSNAIPVIDNFWFSYNTKMGKNIILTDKLCKNKALCNTIVNNKDFIHLAFNMYYNLKNERLKKILASIIGATDYGILENALKNYDGEVIRLYNKNTDRLEVITEDQYKLFHDMETIIDIIYTFYMNHGLLFEKVDSMKELITKGRAELFIIDKNAFSEMYKNGINSKFVDNTYKNFVNSMALDFSGK